MNRRVVEGLGLWRSTLFEKDAGLVQGTFDRAGGVSEGSFAGLNVSEGVGDSPEAVEKNLRRIAAVMGVERASMASSGLVHGSEVLKIDESNWPSLAQTHKDFWPDADAMITNMKGVTLWMTSADCVIVSVVDPKRHAIGLAHAGWRGVVAGVLPKTLAAMKKNFGSVGADLKIAMSPAIGPCCFLKMRENESLSAYEESSKGKPVGINLKRALAEQARQAGVWAGHIDSESPCTACGGEFFFSYRAHGPNTGRMATVLALR